MESKIALLRVLVFCFTVFVCISACSQKEQDIPTPKLTFTDKVDPDFQSITLSCSVSSNVTVERLYIEYSKDKAFTDAQMTAFEQKGGAFVATISGLEIQTTYYYRYSIENKASSFVDEKIRQFKTLDYAVPTVLTGNAKDISGTKAVIEGQVEFACGKAILEQGFYIGTDTQNLEAKSVPDNDLSLSLDNLSFETTYYYQAYAKSEIGIGKGAIKSFKTRKAVAFNQVIVEDISATGIVAKSGVADSDGVDVDIQGFRYSEGTSEEFTFEECTGEKSINGLKPATSYKIWYYAKTYEGEFESEKVEFKTKDGVVLITTSSPTNVSATSATLKANISSDGGSPITERGFFYGKDEDPSLTGTKIKVAGTAGEYQHNLTNLPQNSQYYVRAYAINAIGTYYGDVQSFTTKDGVVLITTSSPTNVSATSATLKANISSDGGSPITERGFFYGKDEDPSLTGTKIRVAGTTGEYQYDLSNLRQNAKYYVCAYAINSIGTYYGDVQSFKTEDGVIVFSAVTASNIKAGSAAISVSINSTGGTAITEHGFCYSTSEMPSISDKKVVVSSTDASYSTTLTSLSSSQLYYIRAYAKNIVGTHYSGQTTFTTLSGLPSFTAISANNVTTTSIELTCSVTADGGANITQRGFCYSLSPNPTIGSKTLVIVGTTGKMTGSLSNLVPASMYYIKAYAQTAYGTSYSGEISVSTDSTIPVSGITLNKTSLVLDIGEYETLTATIMPDDATDKTVVWESSNASVASVSDGTVHGLKEGSATITASAGNFSATCSVTVIESSVAIPDAVDLGLSVKWASYNLGASSPEESGDYYAWGEIEPYYSSLDPLSWKEGKTAGYAWSSYRWCNGSGWAITKYNTDPNRGIVDGKTVLELADDAAHVKLGGNWRIPTLEEWDELLEQCTWEWTTHNGVSGQKATGPNGNSIFLPPAGLWYGTRLLGAGNSYGHYCSSSLDETESDGVSYFYFGPDDIHKTDYFRHCGYSVRPVTE